MSLNFLGMLTHSDHLYDYLRYEIQPQTAPCQHCDYRVFKYNASNDVYLYEEVHTGAKFIGKFFHSARRPNRAAAEQRMEREFHHLCLMRGLGFDRGPHYVARPLGRNRDLGSLLVIEYCYGESMSSVISRAIRENNDALLFAKLTALAWFLSRFHNRTVNEYPVDFNEAYSYAGSLIADVRRAGLLNGGEDAELYHLRDRWNGMPCVREDRQVIVHGDATPENFLFGDDKYVITFDLERLRRADRVHDVGRVVGELAHFFMAATGDRGRAEPFIGHFLWEYACHFPDRAAAFHSIAQRVPFYMGINLLRIARNNYLSSDYRRKLIYEGKQCLKG
ncbi:MAG: aminoglycoside phosphotransferase family protein [Victivallaceae bacterium]|nr:aminoglycoside phosphotransferase family protein [Victivallaceae bacterium]